MPEVNFGGGGSANKYLSGGEKCDDAIGGYFVQSIEKGTDRFQYADEMDITTIRYLEQLLAYCYEKEIKVIAFTPPFAPTVCKAMDNENYKYMKQIAPTVQLICEQYGYEFYDFTDVSNLGCTDDYFVERYIEGMMFPVDGNKDDAV